MHIQIPNTPGFIASSILLPEIKLFHHGAILGVTGSCHRLVYGNTQLLVDCGSGKNHLNLEPFPFKPQEIDWLILTHAHIDHIGRTPQLFSENFRGKILCSQPTRALLFPMLQDSLKHSKLLKRSKQNHKWKTKLAAALKNAQICQYGEWISLNSNMEVQFRRAGHILGSAYINLRLKKMNKKPVRITFSGDLGASRSPLLPSPDRPYGCDLLILESTYGNRNHRGKKNRTDTLEKVLTHAINDNGRVIIPAFSLGRTQEILYELKVICDRNNKFRSIPVVLDSPLGQTITEHYQNLVRYWKKEAKKSLVQGKDPFDFESLYTALSFRSHQAAMNLPGPAIIIAGSGMCTGGRILDHLEKDLPDERNDIIFVGYQAKGTLGKEIQRCAGKNNRSVRIKNRLVKVNAGIHTLSGYSAHADSRGLINWVKRMKRQPKEIRLVHGEYKAKQALKEALLKYYSNY